ncbi:MAG TPA: carboxypeptidase-like regulatory domain-containing protein [Polyangia bacterium]|nr:carboxypeptidase-like regulatory domain-containing protein [Polyangia bacterium]
MRTGRALVALGCLALAACGASAAGKNNTGGGGNATGAAGSTGAGGGLPICQIDILPIVPASFDGLAASPTATVRVRGSVTGPVPMSFGWRWTVTLADGTPVPVAAVANDPSLVEFATTTVGTYTIAVELTDAPSTPCAGLRTITVAKPGAKIATFRMHVTPPTTASVPAQDLQRQVTGGTPSGGNTLALDPGIVVGFDVRRAADGSVLPSYVRLTEATTGAVLETRTSMGGANTLRVAQGTYGALIVPDGDVAPVTYPPRAAAEIGAGGLALDDGPAIAGTVADAGGAPVAGATVVLRDGDLVSTTGKTDASGAFHLRARAGTFGVTVVTPLAAGGLEARLDAAGGLVVDATAPTPPLVIKLQTGALVTGTVALSSQDPASLGTGARVAIATTAPLAGVATLAVGAGAPRALQGDVRFSLHPAADGTVSTGGVPPGRYDVTVFPASASSSDAVTKATLDLTKGSSSLPVALAQKVMLTGKLLPADASRGVRIVAQDQGGLPVAAEGDAGQDGSFALAVSPFLPYLLRALPRADQALARASFPVVTVTDQAPPALDYDMPPALLFAGRVVDPSLQGVSTALVQAFCIADAPGCADATVPVAETITRSDGTFQLMLPDPDGTP